MSKMTTEQFLSHLGIEVGITRFTVKEWEGGNEYIVRLNELNNHHWLDCKRVGVDDRYYVPSKFSVSDLVNKEITPLPKYTLTEDEKAIVKLDFQCGGEEIENCIDGVFVVQDGQWIIQLNSKMFNFIPEGTKVPIDELRKCL